MGIICREISELPALKKIQLIAGESGLEKSIRWVYVAECFEDTRQVVDWLYGGELVFITGRDIKDDEGRLCDLIKKINDKNVSGLLINIGPYIREIPENVIKLADELGFPVFTIPWETRLVDVTRELCEAIITKEMENETVDNLLENILFGEKTDEDYIKARAANFGYNLDGPFMICTVEIANISNLIKEQGINSEKSIMELKNKFKRIISDSFSLYNRKSLITIRNDTALILVKSQFNDQEMMNGIAKRIISELHSKLKGMEVHIGIGSTYSQLQEMKKSLHESELALKTARLDKGTKTHHYYKDMGLYSILFNVREEHLLEEYCRQMLGKLLEYDELNSSGLLATLEMYINESCSITTTAEKMFLHRNTLKYRLNKIEEITHVDLKNIRDLVNLDLGIMIHRYLVSDD